MERRQHRRVVSLPLADRSVLQADQADAPVGRLSRHQRQRRAVAGVDSLACLSPAPVSGLSLRMESQLQPALYFGPRGVVEKVGCVALAASLWDSRWSLTLYGTTRSGIFPRFCKIRNLVLLKTRLLHLFHQNIELVCRLLLIYRLTFPFAYFIGKACLWLDR